MDYFLGMVRNGSRSPLFGCGYSVVSALLVGKIVLLEWYGAPVTDQLAIIVLIVSGISSAPMVCVSDLTPASHAVECSALESVWGHSPLSSLLFPFVLIPPSPLPFPVNCRVSLLISVKQSMLGFGENCCLSNTGSSHPWTWMHLYWPSTLSLLTCHVVSSRPTHGDTLLSPLLSCVYFCWDHLHWLVPDFCLFSAASSLLSVCSEFLGSHNVLSSL